MTKRLWLSAIVLVLGCSSSSGEATEPIDGAVADTALVDGGTDGPSIDAGDAGADTASVIDSARPDVTDAADVALDTAPDVDPDAPPTCTDKKKNGLETDVDCGGGTCDKCPDAKGCGTDDDCVAADCYAGFCSPPPYINYLSPASGVVAGHKRVVITGGNFYVGGAPAVASITFGGVAGDTISYINPKQVEVYTPPGAAPGPVKVVVTTTYGRTVEAGYTYE